MDEKKALVNLDLSKFSECDLRQIQNGVLRRVMGLRISESARRAAGHDQTSQRTTT